MSVSFIVNTDMTFLLH